jgi:hypothetical protein
MLIIKLFYIICLLILYACSTNHDLFTGRDAIFLKAEQNAALANQAWQRSQRFVEGWLQHADPETGLIPRNLTRDKDIWNANDAAADNYPFMVLTTAFTDQNMFNGIMLDMLHTEERLTSRIGHLPDTYSFSKNGFNDDEIDLKRIIFGASEYVKDGLLPLTEWLGNSPWSVRMKGIVEDLWTEAHVSTPYGNIPSESHEINGELLQVMSRLYWMTGEIEYLQRAFRLADYYLLGDSRIHKSERIRLRDHGCEIIGGLSEIYLAAHFAAPEKKKIWQKPLQQLLDRILELGRNEHGMLYNWINPISGAHDDKLCDTWGYNYNAYYTLYLIEGIESYRKAVLQVLSNLNEHYRDYDWEGGSADGYADAIEGAINLYNREPIPSVAEWIDNQTQIMWSKQQPDGVIEGWHGDGNFARTTIMYALWKTQGLRIQPWREDVKIGAERQDDILHIFVKADRPWQGKILFDIQRHLEIFHLPLDYPRINQFPQWFTINAEDKYRIQTNNQSSSFTVSGRDLLDGFSANLTAAKELYIVLQAE